MRLRATAEDALVQVPTVLVLPRLVHVLRHVAASVFLVGQSVLIENRPAASRTAGQGVWQMRIYRP
jgi:hypothetical protein